jgi:hypothetical protein
MDLRFVDIYLVYIAAYLGGQFVIVFLSSRHGDPVRDVPLTQRAAIRYFLVLGFALVFVSALVLKTGGLAVFSSNPNLFRRDFVEAMGGFVIYPTFLLTPLAALALFQYLQTKRGVWLAAWIVGAGLQLMQLNRQEVVLCCVTPLMVLLFFRRISIWMTVLVVLAGIIGVYALGVLAIERVGGAEAISQTIPSYELPFWVVVTDLTGTIRLGHHVIDVVGSSGLHGSYVWGVFISIIAPSNGAHGAMAIRDLFTESQTAQSIPAPLSYYADGGMLEVALLALVQGALIRWLWRLAKQGDTFSRFVYVFHFLFLVWTIRSGTVSFAPIMLFEFAALSFIFGRQARWGRNSGIIPVLASNFFLLMLPITLLALAMRF